MKKKIWIIIALIAALLIGGAALLFGGNQAEAPAIQQEATVPEATVNLEDLEYALEYIRTLYKSTPEKTTADYKRIGTVRVGLQAYSVTWSVDVAEEHVKVVAGSDGTVIIDVNENSEEEIPYVLTATVSDDAGNSLSTSWNHILPGVIDEEMLAIVDMAYALEEGQSLPEAATLRGVITSIDTPYDSSYKNISVVIEVPGREDKPILCYRLKGEGAENLAVGDTITVTGIIKNYKGTIEFDAGCTLDSVVKGDNEAIKAPEDPAEIMKQAYALAPGKSLPYTCTLTGTITSVDEAYSAQYNNITVTMLVKNGGGYSVKCYRMKGTGIDTLNVNDIITVTGQIKNYNGTIEFNFPSLDSVIQKDPPKQPSDPKAVVDAAYKLDPYKSLPYEATLTGKVTDIRYRWSEQYPSVSLTIVVEGRENKPLYCYSMTGSLSDMKNVEIGDTVTVRGMIKNYYNTNDGTSTIEYDRPTLVKLVKNTAVAPSDPKQIVDEAFALDKGEFLEYKATLTGKIVRINTPYDSGFKNITVTISVEGSNGMKDLMCYRLKGDGASELKVGDIITVTGNIKNYNGTIEFDAGCTLDKVTEGDADETPKAPEDPKEIVDAAFKLEEGDTLPYEAQLTGKIVSIDTPYDSGYNNITVSIEVEGSDGMKVLKCYRLKGEGADTLAVGDEITVKGYIKNYNGTIEFDAGCTIVTDTGDDDEKPQVGVTPVAHKDLEEETAYKFYLEQKGVNKTLYFNGKMSGKFLAATENPAEGVDVFVEKVEDGIRLYFMDGENKTYIEIMEGTNSKGNTAGYPLLSAEPTMTYTYDADTNLYIGVFGDNEYYYGTYGTYETFSTSSTYYITGDNAANVGVSQYVAQFGIYNGEEEEPEKPEEPEVPTTVVTPVAHKDVQENTAYKFYMEQVSLKKTLYFTGKLSGEYLATSEKASEGADVFMEKAEGGVRFYYMDGETKTYIEIKLNDAGKPRPKLSTEPSVVYTYDEETGIYVVEIDGSKYYYGTYGTWDTISTSSTYYITGDNAANAGVTQYIAQFGIYNGEAEKPEEPETPDVPEVPALEVTPVVHKELKAGTAYKFFLEQKNVNKVLYFNGELAGEYLATTENAAEGVDVFLEEVEGGVRFYYMDGEAKTYIEIYKRDDGKVRPKLSTEPTAVYIFDEESQLYVVELGDRLYYYGTYNTFETFSASGTSYITGSNAANVGVTQFVGQFGTYGAEEEEEKVSGPYLFYVEQVNLDKTLYFNGQMSGDYLATTEDSAEAAEVYMAETVEGTLIYFLDGETKTYIEIYLNSNNKPRHKLSTEPTMAYTLDDVTGLYVAELGGNKYYNGTYKEFATISASSTWYIIGDNEQNVGKTQFVAKFKQISEESGCRHDNLVHMEAVSAGCHMTGNIEHWYCTDCETVWQDEALTQVTNHLNVIVPATGNGNVVHMEAIAPACHYEGNVEYWICYTCEQVWTDEALTQLSNTKNIVVPALGGDVIHVDAVTPGCESEGNIEYWYCEACEQFWQDEALTQLTNSKNVILPADHQNIIHMEAVAPACHYDGNAEHWYCADCDTVWADETRLMITNHKNVILPAYGAQINYVPAVEPGCHMTGNIEHWVCYSCQQVWQDEALTQLTNIKNVVVPALGGDVVHVEAKEATAEAEGNIEHWYCEKCQQVWQDEALTQLTNHKNVILPKLEICLHENLVHQEAIEPGCHMLGQMEHWYCNDCEVVWQDEALTQVTNHLNVVVPVLGGDVVHVEAKEPTETAEGNIEHWYCEKCEQVWQDEALTQLTNRKNVILPMIGAEVPADPEADTELTIEEAIALGAGKEHNSYTEGKYYVTGVIKKVYNTQYGNMYITDDAGNELTVYGSYSADGKTPYADMEVKPEAGDTITVYGIIGQYNGAPQLKNGWITEHIPAEKDEPEDEVLDTPEKIVNAAYALKSGEALDGKYTLTGEITEIDTPYSEQYKNISVVIEIEDVEDKPILCFRMKGDDVTSLAAGDTITVTGTLKNYNGTIEFDAGCTLDELVKGENEAVVKPEDPKDIVDAAFALAEGEILPYEATLKGQITEIQTAYDPGYKNITVVISVKGNNGMQDLVCFRMKGTGAEDLVVGDYITVTGVLKNYRGTIEFDSGCSLDAVESSDPSID